MSDSKVISSPCKRLVMMGLPGSGKKAIAHFLGGVLASPVDFGEYPVPPGQRNFWQEVSVLRWHTEWAVQQIHKGNLIRSTSYWRDFFERVKAELELVTFYNRPLIIRGTFLSPSLRSRMLELINDGATYAVWLSASKERLKERLAKKLVDDPTAFFQPDWLDGYFETCEEPEAAEDSKGKLRRSKEDRVFILDADKEHLWRKVDYLTDRDTGIPGLNDARICLQPGVAP